MFENIYFNSQCFTILQDEMQRFVKKIVDLMRQEMLFSWQGGPIIMLQVVWNFSMNMKHGSILVLIEKKK